MHRKLFFKLFCKISEIFFSIFFNLSIQIRLFSYSSLTLSSTSSLKFKRSYSLCIFVASSNIISKFRLSGIYCTKCNVLYIIQVYEKCNLFNTFDNTMWTLAMSHSVFKTSSRLEYINCAITYKMISFGDARK